MSDYGILNYLCCNDRSGMEHVMEKAKTKRKTKKKVKLQGSVARLKTLILTDTSEKARTLKKLLGRQYSVISSDGFLRDLPKTRLGIDVENNFEPKYITVRGKGELLKQISKDSISARRIYALTDNTPEGEMIALHYCELFGINPSSNFRVILNEITKDALKESINNARAIDMKLIDIFEVRRAINRLFLYNLNPILWHKVYRGITINYPQAILLKLICEQEKKLPQLQDPMTIDELRQEWNKPLTWKSLQMIAARELNLHIGVISIVVRQLYEGVNIDNTCTGLITYYKDKDIVPSSEMHKPEALKEFLTPNHFKVYDLIWKHCKKNKSKKPTFEEFKSMNRYNDYLLMRELEDKDLPWVDTFSMSICSMMKRGYVQLTNEGYKPTTLGMDIFNVLKEYFSTLITAKFINKVEAQINSLSSSKDDKIDVIEAFYKQFNNLLTKALDKLGNDLKPKDPPAIETDVICDKCGRKMLLRRSRYGPFLACSGYPECKNTKPYVEYLEETCPKCGGRLTKRKINRGRVFFSCENYPTCDFSTWDEPQNNTCEFCGSTLLVHRFKDRAPMLYCSNDKCSSRNEHPINKILEHLREKSETTKQKKSKKAAK